MYVQGDIWNEARSLYTQVLELFIFLLSTNNNIVSCKYILGK